MMPANVRTRLNDVFSHATGPADFAAGYLLATTEALNMLDLVNVERFINDLTELRNRGNTVYFAGNGGKCALCSEFVNDLSVALPGSWFRAQSLMENLPGLSAASNDFAWEEALSRRFEPIVQQADMLVGISGSGTSANIVHVMETAKRMGIRTVSIGRGGTIADLAGLSIVIPTEEDGPTEDAILSLIHIIYGWFLRLDNIGDEFTDIAKPGFGAIGEERGSAGG